MATVEAPEVQSVFAKESDAAFTTYDCELTLTSKILGGVPRDPKLIEGWLRAKAGVDGKEVRDMMIRTLLELGAVLGEEPTMEELEKASEDLAGKKHSCGFKRDSVGGLFIESRQIKAAIKESVNINFAGDRWGKTKKGPKSFTAERVFIKPDRIYLGRSEPDDIETFIGHISDQNGKRATLGYFESVETPVIRFSVKSLSDEIDPEQWGKIWAVAEYGGIGAVRSQGFGQFLVTQWEQVK